MGAPRIALIYTGNLRTWLHCKPNHYENIITPECDLFFHTYEFQDPLYGAADNPYKWQKIHQNFWPDPFAEHKFNTRKAPENTAHQTLAQWHNNFVGFCLVPNTYDIYVRIRPDIKFNGKLDFKQYDCTGNNIYIPQGLDYGGVCDQFAFGSYEVMRKYYMVYLNCYDLWNEGALFHSETMQLANLNKQGVNIVRYGSPQHDIIR